ncbi:hypothetical protein NDU88_002386 [Pleurodeles waltl]|uniref:Uncharacterized protein n=1 Tax=Pleurodeles waltl TaxID=8319 RepID=A0AAV7VB15_PLEWA|nr:hypothetical protein NDU88_002386 [Pleurodeles waltl]
MEAPPLPVTQHTSRSPHLISRQERTAPKLRIRIRQAGSGRTWSLPLTPLRNHRKQKSTTTDNALSIHSACMLPKEVRIIDFCNKITSGVSRSSRKHVYAAIS